MLWLSRKRVAAAALALVALSLGVAGYIQATRASDLEISGDGSEVLLGNEVVLNDGRYDTLEHLNYGPLRGERENHPSGGQPTSSQRLTPPEHSAAAQESPDQDGDAKRVPLEVSVADVGFEDEHAYGTYESYAGASAGNVADAPHAPGLGGRSIRLAGGYNGFSGGSAPAHGGANGAGAAPGEKTETTNGSPGVNDDKPGNDGTNTAPNPPSVQDDTHEPVVPPIHTEGPGTNEGEHTGRDVHPENRPPQTENGNPNEPQTGGGADHDASLTPHDPYIPDTSHEDTQDTQPVSVPEPATLGLMSLGLAALGMRRRRRA